MSKKIRNWFYGISSGLRAWYPRSYLNADQETWTRLLDLSMTKAKRLADFISLFTQLGLVNLAFQYWLAKHDASGRGLERAAYGIACLSALGVYLALLFRVQNVVQVYFESGVFNIKWIWLRVVFFIYCLIQGLFIMYAINDFVFAVVHSSNLLKP